MSARSTPARALRGRRVMTVITGDADIFRERLRELFVRYHGFVRRTCNRYVQNPDDAEDLAQEVLLKAARGWPRFGGGCATATWLHRVAANHCADHLRARVRALRTDGFYVACTPPDYAFGPDEAEGVPPAITAHELMEALRNGLEPQELRVLALCYGEELDQETTGRLTGLSRSGVARRLRKIRERARTLRASATTVGR